jgi:hypothetical protein
MSGIALFSEFTCRLFGLQLHLSTAIERAPIFSITFTTYMAYRYGRFDRHPGSMYAPFPRLFIDDR